MTIQLSGVIVNDQDCAICFSTQVLGFSKKLDLPAGESRWLTVVSPEEPEGTQLLLEPDAHPASATYQRSLFEDGVPLTSLTVDDIEKEYERLKALGVVFTAKPADAGGTLVAVFDDTCGNLIQTYRKS